MAWAAAPLLAALATAPDYEWTTTPQYDVSVRFWQRMSRVTGASLTVFSRSPAREMYQTGGICPLPV